jgi:hypothetical protein
VTDRRDADTALLARSGRAAEAAALARPERPPADPIQELLGCPSPVWENAEGSKLADGICVLFSGANRCRAGATHRAWIGCTSGEHLDKSEVCERHSREMLKLPRLHCKRCWNALRVVSDATIIKIEAINDDDAQAPPGASPDLLP